MGRLDFARESAAALRAIVIARVILDKNMIRRIHRFISLGLLGCAMSAMVGLCNDHASIPARKNAAISAPQTASWLMEVRIRRLHLARPDLIPYPLAYETIC